MARRIALLLTAATGFSALVYEVTWQRYLATLLGSHSEATAAVLGLFLGGLALGYAAFGRVARRLGTGGRAGALLRAYGGVEIAIGAYALVFPALFTGVRALAGWLPAFGEGVGFALDVALAALLIGPPAVAMGATVPLLTQALPRRVEEATRIHATVYALNTAGAFAGTLAAGFVLVPRLGLVGALWAMAAVNLAAGAAYLALARRIDAAALPPPPRGGAPVAGLSLWAAAAALLGFAMMAVQTVLIRLGALSFGSSEYTFTLVVAVFVACIALGSAGVSALPRVTARWLLLDVWGLALLLGLLYPGLDAAPYWVHALRTRFGLAEADFLPFYAASFGGLAAVIGPAVALSGASLPLVFHLLRREVGEFGASAGRLYGWNTLGSLLGALVAGYALLFWLDLHHVYRIAVAAVLLAAALVTARVAPARTRAAGAVAVLGGVLLALLPAWRGEWLSLGAFRMRVADAATEAGPAAKVRAVWEHERILFYDDDPTLTAVVAETVDFQRRSVSIATNGKTDGNTIGDYRTMSMIALVPALLADRVERGFVIGFGTGVTAGELASLPEVREVVVAEISRGVLAGAPHFDFANGGASRHPKIETRRSDAYRALLRSSGRYDLILSEPSNPWTTGVEMLFSREYLEAARGRLAPGGVYAQWMHQYETDEETVAMVLRTFAAVFPRVSIWYTATFDLMILGFEDATVDADAQLERILARAERPAYRGILARAGFTALDVLLSHELVPIGAVAATPLPGPLHTLLHPRLAHVAGRAFFSGGAAPLPFTGAGAAAALGAENALLRRLAERRDGGVLRLAALAAEACANRTTQCGALLARWRVRDGTPPAWRRAVAKALRPKLVFGPPLDRKTLGELALLYEDGGPIGAVSLARARRATVLYQRYYQHAVPFAPDRLRAVWRRCRAPAAAPAGCRRGAAWAERMLTGGRGAAPEGGEHS